MLSKNNPKLILIVIILLISAVGYYLLEIQSPKFEIQKETQIDTSAWKTYYNARYGFSLQIPPLYGISDVDGGYDVLDDILLQHQQATSLELIDYGDCMGRISFTMKIHEDPAESICQNTRVLQNCRVTQTALNGLPATVFSCDPKSNPSAALEANPTHSPVEGLCALKDGISYDFSLKATSRNFDGYLEDWEYNVDDALQNWKQMLASWRFGEISEAETRKQATNLGKKVRRASIPLVQIVAASPGLEEPPVNKPNIILIISDDQGWPHFHFMEEYIANAYPNIDRQSIDSMPPAGVPILTPNLDEMVKNGALFPNAAVTASTCNPSLASILRGLYPGDIEVRKKPDVTTGIPQFLKDIGYVSLQAGKWWEGNQYKWGFTETTKDYGLGPSKQIGRETMEPVYEFIKKHNINLSPEQKKPFFIWFAPAIPHTQHSGFPQDIGEYWSAQGAKESVWKYQAMITWLDRLIGELKGFLEQNGIANNTLIIFVVDNGAAMQPSKGSFTENGIRTPIILYYPGVISGGIHEELVSSLDILPTILDYANATNLHELSYRDGFEYQEEKGSDAPIPAGIERLSLRSLAEDKPTPWRKYLFGHKLTGDMYTVNDGRYKIYARGEKVTALYDLDIDPFEKKNLAKKSDFEGIINELKSVGQDWWVNRITPPLKAS